VKASDGSVGWPSHPTPHLYGGTLGIAFFLAALDHVQGPVVHRETVLRAIAPLRRTLRNLTREPDRARSLEVPVGGLLGLGSLVYGLTRIGAWLEDPAVIRDARSAALLMTEERIRADERLDVHGGCAGALLALLVLDRHLPSPGGDGRTPLELADACGRRLVERRTRLAGSPPGWPACGEPPVSGFAHGAAGISYALLRLYARTGRPEHREAAADGLAFERTLYAPEADSWRDPRYGRLVADHGWCHGAPGIALGRLGALDVHDDAETRAELSRALAATRVLPDAELDHLCCGNLGRAEVLLQAYQALGDSALLDDAHAIADRVLRRAEGGGGPSLTPRGDAPGFRAALFCGTAGVGYALLRLAAPSCLPTPLLLE
jgi:lantibiotic modifying enzyme